MSIASTNIAAVVVVYNPSEEVLRNIFTYIDYVDKLYLYDNSPTPRLTNSLSKYKSKIEYLGNGKNNGIAFALNVGANKAIKDGYKLLLTMDQDSSFSDKNIPLLFDFTHKFSLDNIGIISPFHNTKGYRVPVSTKEYEEVLAVMTSGNMLNLEIFKRVGGFLEEFFIDYVDFEYCLRLNSMGYKVIQLNNIILEHNLGELITRKFFGRTISVTNHPPLRLYYRTRNRLYVTQKYCTTFFRYSVSLLRLIVADFIKVVFFEKQKFEKMKMIGIGIIHFFLRRDGEYLVK